MVRQTNKWDGKNENKDVCGVTHYVRIIKHKEVHTVMIQSTNKQEENIRGA